MNVTIDMRTDHNDVTMVDSRLTSQDGSLD